MYSTDLDTKRGGGGCRHIVATPVGEEEEEEEMDLVLVCPIFPKWRWWWREEEEEDLHLLAM